MIHRDKRIGSAEAETGSDFTFSIICQRRSGVAERAMPSADDFVHRIFSRPPRDQPSRRIHGVGDDDGELLFCRGTRAIRHTDCESVAPVDDRLSI
jgi:hypothetical protein